MKKLLTVILSFVLGLVTLSHAQADSVVTTWTTGSAVVTATTTLVLPPSPGGYTIYWLGVLASGTESGATYLYETGTQASTPCDTGAKALFGVVAQSAPTTSGQIDTLWAGSNIQAAAPGYIPTASGFYIPPNVQLCVVSAGTTINFKPQVGHTP